MSLDQLRSFVTVAEERHVGRAAKRLCLSQPPVSRQICRLEDELGAPLFVRHPRGMELSDAGIRLLPVALRILEDVERCAEAVRPGTSSVRPRVASDWSRAQGKSTRDD